MQTWQSIYKDFDKKNYWSVNTLVDRLVLYSLIASILLFILFPILAVVFRSVYENGRFTLEYYKDLYSIRNIILVKNSIFVATLSSIFATCIATCIALHVFVMDQRRKTLVYHSLMLTMISPPFVSALALIMLFGRRGLITYGLFGMSANPYGWQGIVLLQTIGAVSLAAIMLISALEDIDPRQILASRDLGASSLQTLTNVIIPSVWPAILSVLFIQFTIHLADFGTPVIIGGSYKVLATAAYIEVLSSANLGKAAAISVLMIPPAVIAFLFYRKHMLKMSHYSKTGRLSSQSGVAFALPQWLKWILNTVTALYFFVMFLKYGNIFLSTVTTTASGSLKFTLAHFRELPSFQIHSFMRSLWYSIVAGVLSSVLGIVLSYYTHRRKIRGMACFEFMASLPYIIPGTFFGLGYVAAFSQKPMLLAGTGLIIILNFAFRQISVSNKAANAAFTIIDEKIEFAAQDLGASQFRILTGIIFPLLKPTFLTGFITVFTSSMTAVGAIVFLISPGKNVASVVMFQSIENGRYGVGAVQASAIILVTVVVNVLAIKLLKRDQNVMSID